MIPDLFCQSRQLAEIIFLSPRYYLWRIPRNDTKFYLTRILSKWLWLIWWCICLVWKINRIRCNQCWFWRPRRHNQGKSSWFWLVLWHSFWKQAISDTIGTTHSGSSFLIVRSPVSALALHQRLSQSLFHISLRLCESMVEQGFPKCRSSSEREWFLVERWKFGVRGWRTKATHWYLSDAEVIILV